MAAYRLVYDSRHLQADSAKDRDQLRNPTLGNRVWAAFLIVQKARIVCSLNSRDTSVGRALLSVSI